ncbi:DUF1127 domain-containing protein [Cereibacter johrii]|uniref:DUF1127 domain-containing protein n=1 Tax=Cereibacter johrii TaxID=445629 RepID=UPI000DCF10C5|nr:hypothetical protein [Cereibacter johrii]RAZ86129.1 hypothetical protein DDV93_06895 [Cereibacter johrii]RDS93849.1 hypothetical protein DWF04_22115 [Cereibacter sphaeroides f. sp. denitrificans]
MLNRVRALFDRWHRLQEIHALSDRDLDDLGITRWQMEQFARMPEDVGERLLQMAQVFGLEPATVQHAYADYLDLLDVCRRCGSTKLCKCTLAEADRVEPADCSFCPNAGTYELMARHTLH